MSAEKEAFEKLYYPMSVFSNIEKFDDFCKGWRAATEAAEALKPSHNSAMVPCVHVFDVYNHGEVECRICKQRFQLGWALDAQHQ